MNEHDAWHASVWKGTNDASASLLDDPNTSFDVAHVLCRSGCIEGSLMDVIFHLFELVIHKNGADREPSTRVNVHDTME